jgi:hypothetical protein
MKFLHVSLETPIYFKKKIRKPHQIYVPSQKTAKNYEAITAHSKSSDLIFRTFKKTYSSRGTIQIYGF